MIMFIDEDGVGCDANFGEAIKALKDGKKVNREGWNGKGMWLVLIKGATVQQAIGDCYGNNGETFPVLDAVYMKTADGHLVPWLCSQPNMIAEECHHLAE